ncbi:MAG: methyltransferase domain-containing protein [Silvibacterium sp.]
MLRSLFNREPSRPERTSRTVLSGPRIPRHSSGWGAMLKHLKEEESLRVLDIGPTSPSNINFLTGLGHSCYMADVVPEALTGQWVTPPTEEGGDPGFDEDAFFEQNLNFGGRLFDVVLLWTTLDYIPEGLVKPFIQRLHAAMKPGGRILAIFHTKAVGPDTTFCRYHLTDGDTIEMQESEPHPILRVYTNRSIEKLFSRFSNYRFFLAKDNIYEVIITR